MIWHISEQSRNEIISVFVFMFHCVLLMITETLADKVADKTRRACCGTGAAGLKEIKLCRSVKYHFQLWWNTSQLKRCIVWGAAGRFCSHNTDSIRPLICRKNLNSSDTAKFEAAEECGDSVLFPSSDQILQDEECLLTCRAWILADLLHL